MQHEFLTLKNKLKTLFVHSPGSTSASVQIWFRAGSALEEKSEEGIAHFLEHMFFKGTAKRPGAKIAHDVETFGGDINAFTSFDYTCYYINTPCSHLEKSVEILLDMVSNPLFGEKDIPTERDVVFEEYRRSIDSPNQYAFMRMQEKTFMGGYGHPILGRPETIKKFSKAQLLSFRKRNYNLSNALFVVAGDLKTKNKLTTLIERYKMPQGPASEFPPFKLTKKEVTDIHNKDVRMAQLTLALQAPPWASENAAYEDLAINCLGYGETCPLHKGLVLEGSLASAVNSSSMFMNDGGFHYIKILFPFENLEKVLKKTLTILEEVNLKGFHEDDLQKIKNQYIATKIYDKESLEAFSFALGHSFAQTGDFLAEEKFLERVKATDLFKINEALREMLTRTLQINLQVGKEDKTAKAQKALTSFRKEFKKLSQKSLEEEVFKSKPITIAQDVQVRQHKIKEGVTLIYRQNKMTPTFVFYTYIKAGQVNEKKETMGIHNLMSSQLNKGNIKKNFEEIRKLVEDRSASFQGFSGKNAYGLSMHAQTAHSKELLDLYMNTLLAPSFPEEHFEIERQLTLRALENQKEDPVKQCLRLFTQMVFHNHPYEMNILGNTETLKTFDTAQAAKLHKEHLQKEEIVFTYCGSLDEKELLALLAPYFEEIKPRKLSAEKKISLQPKKGERNYLPFEREQTHFLVGMPIPKSGDRTHLYLKMITAHLSGQSSELFVEVRDRQGLCYSAQPIHFIGFEAGYWGIYMASGHEKLDQALKAVYGILEKIKREGLTKEEFERVKTMLQGQSLLSIQTNDDYATIYSLPVIQHQGLDFYARTNAMIAKMSHKEFQENIKRLFSTQWNETVVGKADRN